MMFIYAPLLVNRMRRWGVLGSWQGLSSPRSPVCVREYQRDGE